MRNSIVRKWLFEKARRVVQETLVDRRGVAAIEFALIVPILIALYFGAVEFSNAMTVDRRVTSIASSAADLAAQVEEVNANEVLDIFNASRSIMQPYDTNGISIVLTSVVADEDNNTTVRLELRTERNSARGGVRFHASAEPDAAFHERDRRRGRLHLPASNREIHHVAPQPDRCLLPASATLFDGRV